VKRLRYRARTRAFNILDRRATEQPNLDGFWFVLEPTSDPAAWDALAQYSTATTNMALKEALIAWLSEHPRPAEGTQTDDED